MKGLASLRLYSAVSELFATPLMAAAALFKAGPAAARQTLALGAAARPECSYLLWVHGASVGETVSALPLVRMLLARDAKSAVLMTASTATALTRLSMEHLGPRVLLQHRPADGSVTMRRFLRRWRPDGLLVVESELWPSLLLQTHACGVPIALVNGRLSERSLDRWHAFAPATLKELLRLPAVTLAKSPRMAEQLCEAGSPAATYCGDLKHARGADSQLTQALLEHLREALALRPDGPLWLAASTHDGEEAAVLSAHAALRSGAHPNLLLLLVPRHPERGADVAAAAAATGLEVARRRAGHIVVPTTAVYVCDTLGELPALYALAPIAFVGGSLVPLGGHNVLEPAQAPGGCAVLHGPYVEATAEAAAALGATEPPAAQCVRSAEELHARLDEALRDVSSLEARRAAAARAARALEEGVNERVWGALEGPLGLPGSRSR